jgi:biotin transport system substrate-specific component
VYPTDTAGRGTAALPCALMTGSSASIRPAAPAGTLADVLVPAVGDHRTGELLRGAVLVLTGTALTAISAQLSFKMPWTEVPYTGQTAAVLLVGTALGWRLGALSMLLYLLLGIAGAPVFSAGEHGLDQVLGFTGGYLVAFVLAAALVGRLAELRWDRTPARAAGLMLLGNLLIYAIGVPVLAVTLSLPLTDAIWSGAAVFLPWDAFKIVVAAALLPAAWLVIRRNRGA